MSGCDEKDFDLAEKMAERQREVAIRRAQLALECDGRFDCQDCEHEIEPARREAMPSATRCIACQTRFERERRKGR